MRLKYLITALLITLTAVGAFWLSDGNRMKEDLALWLGEQSGYQVEIEGNLDWQILGGLGLAAQDVRLIGEEEDIRVGSISLSANFGNLFQSLDDWQVKTLQINDAQIASGDSNVQISRLLLTDFRPNTMAPFQGSLSMATGAQGAAYPIQISGMLRYVLESGTQAGALELLNTRVMTEFLEANCAGRITGGSGYQGPTIAEHPEDLVSIPTLYAADTTAQCDIQKMVLGDRPLPVSELKLSLQGGELEAGLTYPTFYQGDLQIDLDLTPEQGTLAWTIDVKGQGIDSSKVFGSDAGPRSWQAIVEVDASISATGNQLPALVSGAKGTGHVTSQSGYMDVSRVKVIISLLSQLAGKSDPTTDWGQRISYRELDATWTMQGQAHELDTKIDNLRWQMSGPIDLLADRLDLRGHISASAPGADDLIRMDPAFYDIPIPIKCAGTLADPGCATDREELTELVAQLFLNAQKRRLQDVIEDAVKDQLPEPLQDAAKSLLNLFKKD